MTLENVCLVEIAIETFKNTSVTHRRFLAPGVREIELYWR